MPENTVYVGRGSSWGNEFVIGRDGDAAACVRKYIEKHMPYTHHGERNSIADYLISEAFMLEARAWLRGVNLACWCCEGEPCHADFLLSIANG